MGLMGQSNLNQPELFTRTNGERKHDFKECLAFSHLGSSMSFWEGVYRTFFPTMMNMLDMRHDGPHQRNGVDRVITLHNSKQVTVDEKLRGRNRKTGKVYEDIALEEFSDEARKTPGWVTKPLMCDYIAYAIAPLGKCYLLPVIQLQTAWLMNCSVWKQTCFEVRAYNKGWVTVSWAVPVKDVFRAVGACLRAEFEKFEITEE